MAQIPGLPITMIASVRGGTVNITRNYNNSSSVYNNYPYEFSCTLDITPLSTSEDTKLNSQFQFDADRVARFCAQRLGYPLVDVELQDINFYTAFEEAVTTYGNEMYEYKVRENYL